MKKIILIIVTLIISSCANHYEQFYKGKTDANTSQFYDNRVVGVKIIKSSNIDTDAKPIMKKGYIPIGSSSFTSSGATEQQLLDHAKKIGAHVVLFSSIYAGESTGAIPLTVPNTTTSYSSGSATVFGQGRMTNIYGNGTTTTYGSQTVMVPYSVKNFQFSAVYFVKIKSQIGLIVTPMDDETKRRLQTNSGAIVNTVIDNTPAFMADILPGDVILTIDGERVQSPEHCTSLFAKNEGKSIVVVLERNGNFINKTVPVRRLIDI